MAEETQSLKDLKACMKKAKNQAERDVCQAAFDAQPSTTVEGGKVFSTPDGNGAFVTDGGKVFGGKVF